MKQTRLFKWFVCLVALWVMFPQMPTGDYYKHFTSRHGWYAKRFQAKLKAPPPAWMLEQIQADLAPFSKRKISRDALDKTEAAIHTSQKVVRYQIVNNQLSCSKNMESFEPAQRFRQALLTLCQLVCLPDVDFIVNHEDGTGEPFYLTEDEEDQAPIFGWAKLKTTPYLVLIPDYRSVSTLWFDNIRKLVEGKSFVGERLSWAEKENKAFWRGVYTEPVHRLRITQLSDLFPDQLDAGLTHIKSHASYEEHLRYKYLPVLDGIMCSYPGYQWRLLSGSLTFKQESDQIQWFYRALKPYVHYVPVANDLSDLMEQIQWAQGHDSECEQIAENARAFALENLMFDDVYLYLYLVLKEYASLII